MEKVYSMQSKIRFLQGRVDVNYYNDDSSNEAKYIPENSLAAYNAQPALNLFDKYAMQVVNGKLVMDKKIALLGKNVDCAVTENSAAQATPADFGQITASLKSDDAGKIVAIDNAQVKVSANCRLNMDFVLCGEQEADQIFNYENAAKDDSLEVDPSAAEQSLNQAVAVGWLGSQFSNDDGRFSQGNPRLTMQYSAPREIDHMVISGYNARGEYPLEFKILYCKENSDVFEQVEYLTEKFFETRITEIEVLGKQNFQRNDFIVYFKPVIAKKVQLQICRWGVANTVPKINYFASEHIECYLGDKLKSISIVEEKTGDTEKLSYGISSNSCSFRFLNENKRFYYNKDYNLLRKNRRVYPYIRCGKGEFSKPLGVFYSEEWKIEDGNPYVSCKAYDVLYPLQDITINYGLNQLYLDGKHVIVPFINQTVNQIFRRVFSLIEEKRRANGIYSKIKFSLQLGPVGEKVIPLVLMEEKSAWDVLQDLANLTCSYIYCNRQGVVIVKGDSFATSQISSADSKKLVSINPSNSFAYSLPVLSNTVVNSVNTEFYDLEEEKEEGDETSNKEIEIKEFIRTDDGVFASINLDKIYDELRILSVTGTSDYKVIKSSFNKLDLQVKLLDNVKNIKVRFIFGHAYSLVKNNLSKQADTIDKFGLRQFDYKAGNLLLNPKINIGGAREEDKVFNYEEMVEGILQKYKLGVTYMDAEWTGDYNLTLGSDFLSISQYDEDGIEEVYECISSEITYDTRFKQTIKGREITEIKNA